MKIKIDFADLELNRLQDMADAGRQIEECYRLLRKAGANVVGRILETGGTFYEYDHYPDGDIFDDETHSQYYYHAHRGAAGEHGHFHTFLRAGGIADGVEPLPYDGEEEMPTGDDAIAHLIAISMNRPGYPIGLFTVNRWVTGESFYSADDTIAMLDGFKIDHTYPCLAANLWVSAMIRLFRPQIEVLLHERDRVIAAHAAKKPDEDAYADRDLELTSVATINVSQQIKAVDRALKAKQRAA